MATRRRTGPRNDLGRFGGRISPISGYRGDSIFQYIANTYRDRRQYTISILAETQNHILAPPYARPESVPGSGTGRAERRRVRPAEAAFRAHLYYALLTCDESVMSGGNQQISPCFLQDLQSEVDYQQTRRSYQRVKLRRGCEGITVCRRVAARGSHDHVVSDSRGASRLLQWFGLHPWWSSVPLQAGNHVSYMRTTRRHPATMWRRAAPAHRGE